MCFPTFMALSSSFLNTGEHPSFSCWNKTASEDAARPFIPPSASKPAWYLNTTWTVLLQPFQNLRGHSELLVFVHAVWPLKMFDNRSGLLGQMSLVFFCNNVVKNVSAKTLSALTFILFISLQMESTSSTGAVKFAPAKEVKVTMFGFRPSSGESWKKYFAAWCCLLPKPQQARIADVRWYFLTGIPFSCIKSKTAAAVSTSPSSAAALIRDAASTSFMLPFLIPVSQTWRTSSGSPSFPKSRRPAEKTGSSKFWQTRSHFLYMEAPSWYFWHLKAAFIAAV